MNSWLAKLALATMFALAAPLSQVSVASDTDYSGNNDSLVSVVIFLENETAREKLSVIRQQQELTRPERIIRVTRQLKSLRVRGADEVTDFLDHNSRSTVIRHWIVPAYTATLTVADLRKLAFFEGVSRIVPNVQIEAVTPVDVSRASSLSTSVSSELQFLGVPSLWARGLTGRGRLVCSFDTGVEQSHPALSTKWRGNHCPLSAAWFSKVQPNVLPYDNKGHGTHTMGIMVGSTTADTFGVAPDAEWITAGVIDQGRSLSLTISDIIEAFQWALNPDGDEGTTDDVPDVILNSWGIPAGVFSPCDQTFWAVIDNVEAAGIATVFAAGNEGPDPKTIRNPADRSTSPVNSFAVGSVDNSGVIASFSSRGPASCDTTQIKPEVVAPGVSVRSSTKNGDYAYMSGTSMSAPFIAGLVALCRQYNPNATVEQIKDALIQSATDLGPTGEDNAYGHGVVDASRLLDYLPEPIAPQFIVWGTIISDDGVACPGESFGLQIVLTNAAANVESINGRLATISTSVTITSDKAGFFFGDGGTTAINAVPYEMALDSHLVHGETIPLVLYLEDSLGRFSDTLDVILLVGYPAPGLTGEHSSSLISFTVSDFGQYGFAPGSIYNLGGDGFRYSNGGSNLLYEAGIVIGRNTLQLASAVRGESGALRPSDFTPLQDLTVGWIDSRQGFHRQAKFADTYSEIPIPVTISQESIDFGGVDNEGLVILEYSILNPSAGILTDLYLGFMADFDLSADSDTIVYDADISLIYQRGGAGPLVGLVGLKNVTSFVSLENETSKSGFSNSELYALISSETISVDSTLTGDLMFLAASGAFTLMPSDSTEVAYALIAGADLGELYDNARRARQHYDVITCIEETDNSLPRGYVLSQNYPNPFNPTTSISFTLPSAGEVGLEVYNVLGQTVRQLQSGYLPAGRHIIEWNARDDNDEQVASGVYFYRLKTAGFSQTKKMVLLK